MAKIRILMLGWEFPPHINGGLGVACEGLAKALSQDTELSLFLPGSGKSYPNDSIRIIPTGDFTHSPALQPYLDANTAENLYLGDLEIRVADYARDSLEASMKVPFDIIHAHDWMTALAGLKIKRNSGKPLVFHVHSLSYDRAGPDENGWIHEIERQVIQAADLVIAVSQHTRKICIDHYGANPTKTVVVHNGISPVRAYRSPKPFRDQLVVFLGRMTRQKGPMHFLEIARKVLDNNPKVRFAMAGTGDQLHALMAGSVRLGIGDRCHFTGFLDREKIHDLLSMADVYCMPSVSEPFGLSALEASQFGVPSVISKQSGVAEIMPDAVTVDAFDTKGMALGILKRLKAGSAEQVLPIRSWEDAARDVLHQYDILVNSPT
jgi:glycosyltransferase involved in cell wall biosynthesis